MDLAAHLARKQLKQLYPEEDAVSDDFTFILYASFPKRDSAIGLELLEALNKLCMEDKNKK
jgi:hypothetical protein